MTIKCTPVDEPMYAYLIANWLREDDVLRQLREETSQLEMAMMQIAPDQGQLMALLAKLIGAKRILEVGTFTGYSALAMAQVIPDDGEVVCCDISEEWTTIAKKYWQLAGVDSKINLHLAPALETLNKLCQDQKSTFDLAFIDADKENYDNYYENTLELLKSGGVVLLDNVFWGGSVVDQSDQRVDTKAIRRINKKIHQDERVDISIITIGDGLTVERKK